MKLLDSAIKAHGGLGALGKLAHSTSKATGTLHGAPYKSTAWWQAPNKWAMDIDGSVVDAPVSGSTSKKPA